MAGSLAQPAGVIVPSEAVCTADAEGRYSSPAFEFTVCGIKLDGDGGSRALQAAARVPGGAAGLAEADKDAYSPAG